jgi:hypothetical protein
MPNEPKTNDDRPEHSENDSAPQKTQTENQMLASPDPSKTILRSRAVSLSQTIGQSVKRSWKRLVQRERSRWSDIVIMIATVVIAAYAVLQYKEIVGAGIQTDKIIAADNRLAKAMEDSVGQAKESGEKTIEQARLDQRAWVVLKAMDGTPRVGEPWVIKFYFSNTGKTPAKNVRYSCNLNRQKTERDVSFKEYPYQSTSLVSPNEANNFCELRPLPSPK